MEKELFCVACGSKKEDTTFPTVYNGICPKCGEDTLYVQDLSEWLYIERKRGMKIFYIEHAPRCIPDTWIDLYEGEKEYKKLVNILTDQKDIKIVENRSGTFKYLLNGYQFQLTLVTHVDYLTSAYDLWDGNPYIEFKFVKKDHPDFEAYKKELIRIYSIIDD